MAIHLFHTQDPRGYLYRLSRVLCQPSVKAHNTSLHSHMGSELTVSAGEHRLACCVGRKCLATSLRRDGKLPTTQGNWLFQDVWDLAAKA